MAEAIITATCFRGP